jgi:anthranilate phosphoribosyltransferase
MKPLLARLADGARLDEAEAEAGFALIMDGLATPAQIAAMLTAMRVRGETPSELRGAVLAARARMRRVKAQPGTIDVCGTGGDGHGTLNVSTAVAFVVAGCGVPVAKHGNRALSSLAGGADVLAALGVDIPADRAGAALAEHGLAFLFAPDHHPALRHAALPRAELGFRTLLNLVGPACNPAGVRRQLLGVFAPRWLVPMAETLGALGAERAWVVHGAGLDELTLAGPTDIAEWHNGAVRQFTVCPEDAGLARAPISAIAGGNAAANATALRALLDGAPGAYRDTVVLNSAAALVIAGRTETLQQGAELAAGCLDSFSARGVLARLLR